MHVRLVIIALITLLYAAGQVGASQRIVIRVPGCIDCASDPVAITVWNDGAETEISPTIEKRHRQFTLVVAPGYYRVYVQTRLCNGERYLGVIPRHDRVFDVPVRCVKSENRGIVTSGRLVDRMQGLAGTIPRSVKSVLMFSVDDAAGAIIATISKGAYYFDESNCSVCVLDITLRDGRRSRIGVDMRQAPNFLLVQHDVTQADLVRGLSTRGSPFNSPGALVEGPAGSIWSLDKFGNRVIMIRPNANSRAYDLPTPFSDPGDILSTSRFVWVTERKSGKIVRFAANGSVVEYALKRGRDERYAYDNLRAVAGNDGRIWYVDNAVLGAIDTDGRIQTFTDGLPIFWLTDIARGFDGRMWVVGFARSYGMGDPFIAAIDQEGRWHRYPLKDDAYRILATKAGSWIAGASEYVSFVDLSGHEQQVSLPINNVRPRTYTVDRGGDFWFSDRYGNIVFHASPKGSASAAYTEAGDAGISDMVTDAQDDVWLAEPKEHSIEQYRQSFITFPRTIAPRRLLLDSLGNLWFSDGDADIIGIIRKNGSRACYLFPASKVAQCFHDHAQVYRGNIP